MIYDAKILMNSDKSRSYGIINRIEILYIGNCGRPDGIFSITNCKEFEEMRGYSTKWKEFPIFYKLDKAFLPENLTTEKLAL